MKIHIDRIPEDGLRVVETRPPEWWTNFSELVNGDEEKFDGQVRLELEVERISSQIHVRGSILAKINTSCARCLTRDIYEVRAPVDVFLTPERPGMVEDTEDEGYETYRGEIIDLTEHLRGQLALHFPSRFYCRTDCRGLCSQCGANLNLEKCKCSESKFDPRWAALKNLKF